MLNLHRDDDALDALVGVEIASERLVAIAYRPLKRLGEGGMALAFLALRIAPEGQCPVVLKVLRPSIVRRFGEKALLAMRKEAVSLGRLNEQVPPTPFVLRLIDAGAIGVEHGERPLSLPWIVVEHVHGGPEGTTLHERVEHAIRATGTAFDPPRAARAVRCLSAGVQAVHEAGVIHRDLKPENVLCCGHGDEELLKVADFGIARPVGIDATFGFAVGTPGYAAPEVSNPDLGAAGAWTDVFGLAAVFFFLLTGEDYFPGDTPHALGLAAHGPRRSLLDTRGLAPELRQRPDACRAVDLALARATAPSPGDRTQTAADLCAEIAPHLALDARRPRRSSGRNEEVFEDESTVPGSWIWSALHRPARRIVIRDVGWDSDGRCLAATEQGLVFWDGTTWRDAPVVGLPSPRGIRFVRRTAPGQWIVGGDQGTFATYDGGGLRDLVQGDPSTRFDLFSGDLSDVAVLAGADPAGTPTLLVLASHRWMKPFPIFDAASIRALAPVDDARWLIAGRGTDGGAYAALFAPFDREIVRLPAGPASELTGAAGTPGARRAVAAGRSGAVLWWEDGVARSESVSPAQDLSCASLGVLGTAWVGGLGGAWMRRRAADGTARWVRVWEDERAASPLVSMFADVGMLLAVTSDGVVIEGRAALGVEAD